MSSWLIGTPYVSTSHLPPPPPQGSAPPPRRSSRRRTFAWSARTRTAARQPAPPARSASGPLAQASTISLPVSKRRRIASLGGPTRYPLCSSTLVILGALKPPIRLTLKSTRPAEGRWRR